MPSTIHLVLRSARRARFEARKMPMQPHLRYLLRCPNRPAPRERAFPLLQVLAEEGLNVVPQLIGRALAIARPVIGEEGVAGALVDLRRHVLAGRLAAFLELGFERNRRVLVFFAEHAE